MRIRVEASRCSGCRLCQQICAITHFRELNPKKAAIAIRSRFPSPGIYEPVVCVQCGECESVCPSGAIENRNGVYVVHAELCSGCGECVAACGEGAMRWPAGGDVPVKCDLCLECTAVCNTGALFALPRREAREDIDGCSDSAEPLSA